MERMPYNVGTQTQDCVTYTTGPYFDFLTLNAYGSGDSLIQSVEQDGSRENWLMQYGWKYNSTVLDAYNTSADFVVTESDGAGNRYLGFNMNEFPGSSKAFRKSVACLFDKETFLASDAAFSNAISENQFVAHSDWRASETGALFDCIGMTQDQRRAYATGKLQEEGWSVDGSWTTFPLVNLVGPNNESLPLNDSAWKIFAPNRDYDELRAGAAAVSYTHLTLPTNREV